MRLPPAALSRSTEAAGAVWGAKIMKTIVRALLAAFVLGLAPSPAMATVYAVDIGEGAYTARGTITTNGRIGVLSESDVTGWNLVVSTSEAVRTMTATTSGFRLFGKALSASAGRLSFDFENRVEDATGFNFFHDASWTYFCVSAPGRFGCGDPERSIVIGKGDDFWVTEAAGIVTIGTAEVAAVAVPEPATWGMMLAGFGMLGAGTRIRRRRATVRLA